MKTLLSGSYDLYINNSCNLSCKNCSVLDYGGNVTIPNLKLDDVKEIISNLESNNLIVDELKIVGGEPTIHKDFKVIVDYVSTKRNCYNTLTLVTNGLRFTDDVVNVCKNFDIIRVSEYNELGDIKYHIKSSPVYKKLIKHSKVLFYPTSTFQIYGEKGGTERFGNTEEDSLYTKELNYERCWQHEECLALTKEGIYRCVITMNERIEVVEWNSAEDVNKDEPLNRCETCYWFPREETWSSLNIKKDIKNYERAISILDKTKLI